MRIVTNNMTWVAVSQINVCEKSEIGIFEGIFEKTYLKVLLKYVLKWNRISKGL